MVVNQPPASTLPSVCTATDRTTAGLSNVEFVIAPGWKVLSKLPSPLSRAMRFRFVPLMLVNSPPTKTLPSVCPAMDQTEGNVAPAQVPGLNVVSKPPSAFSRATPIPPVPLLEGNQPPTSTLL